MLIFIVQAFGFKLYTPDVIKTSTVYWQLHLRSEFILGILLDDSKKKRVLTNMLKALEEEEVLETLLIKN